MEGQCCISGERIVFVWKHGIPVSPNPLLHHKLHNAKNAIRMRFTLVYHRLPPFSDTQKDIRLWIIIMTHLLYLHDQVFFSSYYLIICHKRCSPWPLDHHRPPGPRDLMEVFCDPLDRVMAGLRSYGGSPLAGWFHGKSQIWMMTGATPINGKPTPI